MSTSRNDVWKLGTMARLRKAWRLGGTVERFFAVAIAAEPVIGALIVIPVAFSQKSPSEIVQVLLVGLMAILGQPAFLNAQYAAALSQPFWQAALDNNWMPSFEREYYAELIRYMKARGKQNGLLPGNIAWALAYCILYFGTIASAVAIAVVAWPLVGRWVFVIFAAIEVPVAIISYRLYGWRTR